MVAEPTGKAFEVGEGQRLELCSVRGSTCCWSAEGRKKALLEVYRKFLLAYNRVFCAICNYESSSEQGYAEYAGPLNSLCLHCHGSHTLSTAAGNFVPGATVFGAGNGTAKAFDVAIHDGVDVISVSLGGHHPENYFDSGISIGAFHAVKHGIAVVCSAGNSGPAAGTVTNVAPWVITVGESTLDREFQNFVELRNGLRLKGSSPSEPLPDDTLYPLITGAQAKGVNPSAEDA
ncbi:hypothetical protein ACLB2K_027584 [Fragaria x ananassa]